MLDAEEVIEDRVAAHPDLILVASLVDRPPNLVRKFNLAFIYSKYQEKGSSLWILPT